MSPIIAIMYINTQYAILDAVVLMPVLLMHSI